MYKDQLARNEDLIKKAYAAFNARDIDATLAYMHKDVKWARAWEGDYANGHEEVRAYWTRQWQEIDPHVTPVNFKERENGTLEVEVAQLVKDLEGTILFDGKVMHIHTINNGLIKQMDIQVLK